MITLSSKKDKTYNLIPNKILLSIDDIFKKKECEDLIKISEKRGYKTASLYTDSDGKEHIEEDFRKSKRCIIDNEDFAKRLEKIIYKYIPKVYNNKKYHSINPRFRFLKYNEGGYFARHSDSYYKTNTTISQITILIYLNDDYEGAYTTFYSSPYDKDGIILKPKKGMVCLMDQDIGHSVPELKSGTKYVIRTELMYINEDINNTSTNSSNDKDIKIINFK